MKVNRFEDLRVWINARDLVKTIYAYTLKENFIKDFGLREQLRRASVSISSNIAEGFERNSNKEFSVFLKYAKGSAGEVRTQLYLALDLGYIDKVEFENSYEKVTEISAQISSFIKYLGTQRKK